MRRGSMRWRPGLICADISHGRGSRTSRGLSARLWHDTLPAQLVNASAQAALAGYAGLLLSYHLDTPSGPTIIGCAGALYFGSLIVAPGGWLPRLRTTRHRVA